MTTQTIPYFLAKQPPAIRFMVADDNTLTIAEGDKTICLTPADIERLSRFVNRFEEK